MKRFALNPLLLAALASAGLLGCAKSGDAEPAIVGTGMAGTWQLVKMECECLPGVPNETAVFTDSTFSVSTNGHLTAQGTYTSVAAVNTCGIGNSATPGLRFIDKLPTPAYQHDAQVSLQSNTLVLDYGLPCDVPRKTYQRIQAQL
ncbi:hypothetical protein [Hymenobacter ruricola]|uniref:Lipocalin-like domain-containing protein n=1 Tax=Hymenobacter ruricola TaxID=2791023 RepID=A0ABS0I512_9BACT|nr:hypothetical protein [Hymenobacter ruricola]MBF9222054.1 hypothetical protein [Hymenobacter ruricola]